MDSKVSSEKNDKMHCMICLNKFKDGIKCSDKNCRTAICKECIPTAAQYSDKVYPCPYHKTDGGIQIPKELQRNRVQDEETITITITISNIVNYINNIYE